MIFFILYEGDSILVKPVTAAGATDVLVLFPGDHSQVIIQNFYDPIIFPLFNYWRIYVLILLKLNKHLLSK